MLERLCLVAVAVLVSVPDAYAQEAEGIDEVMRVLGADSPEEMDPEEFERLSDFIEHPLRVNMVSESRLVASGLLSGYQAASLADYRKRHGNVMSFTELAAVDGFNPEIVGRLRRFISLECYTLHESESGLQNDLAVKAAAKSTVPEGDLSWNYGLKYRVRSDRFSLALASSRSYSADAAWPDAYSGSFVYDFKRFRGRLAVGDFNARFGQGLAMWNGTFMTSLNTPDAFMKKPSGISDTWSFTGSSAYTGVAGNFSIRHFTFTLLMALPDIMAANLAWQGRHGSVSVTHVADMRTSVDAAFCIKGVNLFGEMAYDWVRKDVHAVAGTDFPIGENGRGAALMKYLPSRSDGTLAQHEIASSASFGASEQRHAMTVSADLVRYVEPKEDDVPLSIQAKLLAEWRYRLNDAWETRLRLSERLRTWGQRTRTDLRADVIYGSGPWMSASRLNYLHCVGHAFVGYAEQGYKASRLSAYLREGVFFVDDWEDRVYVYERDAPGSFNVPAMYGRGWFGSIVISGKVSRSVKLYLRASYMGYDFMPYEKRKPGKAELKFQLVLRYL